MKKIINIMNILRENLKNIPDDSHQEFYEKTSDFLLHVNYATGQFELLLNDDLLEEKIAIYIYGEEVFRGNGQEADGLQFYIGNIINNNIMGEILKNFTISPISPE